MGVVSRAYGCSVDPAPMAPVAKVARSASDRPKRDRCTAEWGQNSEKCRWVRLGKVQCGNCRFVGIASEGGDRLLEPW